MKARSSLLLVALAALLVPVVGAQDIGLEDRWTIAVQGGLDSEITGNVLSDVQGIPLRPGGHHLPEDVAPDLRAAFRRGAVLIGFGVTPRTEIFARGTFYRDEEPRVARRQRGGERTSS